jgi:hypothetical protein
MDMWKGEKLHGPDRCITRAQLAESDRIPTAPRRSVVREAASAARSLGELYVQTRGRGPQWRAAVLALSRLTD